MSELILMPATADLRTRHPTVDGELARDDVELWYGRFGEIETVAPTRSEALRSLARGLDANSGGRQDTLSQIHDGVGDGDRR